MFFLNNLGRSEDYVLWKFVLFKVKRVFKNGGDDGIKDGWKVFE